MKAGLALMLSMMLAQAAAPLIAAPPTAAAIDEERADRAELASEAPPAPSAPAPPPAPAMAAAPLPIASPDAPPVAAPAGATAGLGLWADLVDTAWLARDGHTIFSYSWNPRHDAVIGEVTRDGQPIGHSVIYPDPDGDGLRMEVSAPGGAPVISEIALPDAATAIQTSASSPDARAVYHRVSPMSLLVEEQRLEGDAWTTTALDARQRLTAAERDRLAVPPAN